MLNLELTNEEYESLVDLCSLSLMVVHYSGESSIQEQRMQAMFNKILTLRENVRDQVPSPINDSRLDTLQNRFFFPCLDNYSNHLNLPQALPIVNEAINVEVDSEDSASIEEYSNSNFRHK